jgi:class 3 adenylate cyclase/HAMP domain-containing protein/sensor domain CHASE-containing protein
MSIGGKIFTAFFVFFTTLLGITLYIVNQQTEEYARDQISQSLNLTQARFQKNLQLQQDHTLKLVQTLTSDQKYRSFLSQIKDPQDSIEWVQKHQGRFNLQDVIDSGEPSRGIKAVDGQLFSLVSVPLKESLRDDYAVGALVVGRKINNQWLDSLFGKELASNQFQVLFFTGKKAVAGNVSKDMETEILDSLDHIGEQSQVVRLKDSRFVVQKSYFGNDTSKGYVYLGGLDQNLIPFNEIQFQILYLGLGVMALGLLFSVGFSRYVARPISHLVSGARKVYDGDYDFEITHKSNDEVGALSEAFNHMIRGLKEKKFLQESFGKYMHPTIVKMILDAPDKLKLGGERQNQALLFSDIANFTNFGEKMEPEALIILLNEYLGAMTEEILNCKGVLNKYIGDSIMAFWGPSWTNGNYSLLACLAAVQMQKTLAKQRTVWIEKGLPEIRTRIGVATGEMVVGNIGSENFYEYTCIGDTVNYCSRLEGSNKYYGTEILIDDNTHQSVYTEIYTRKLDTIQVKGRQTGSAVYEVMGRYEEVTDAQRDVKQKYEIALDIYHQGKFESALANFEALFKVHNDRASEVLAERCEQLLLAPPKSWTGVHTLSEK